MSKFSLIKKFFRYIPQSIYFNFKFLPYNEFELEVASRNQHLVSSYNYLYIISEQKGVGGDNSWGARVHKKYILSKKKHTLSFLIKKEDRNSNNK